MIGARNRRVALALYTTEQMVARYRSLYRAMLEAAA